MKKLLLLLFLCPYLLAIQCPDKECQLTENWEEESIVPLITLSPIQSTYSAGDKVTLTVSVPSNNDFFGGSTNLLENSGDETGLLVLLSDNLFVDNKLTFSKGAQGKYENWLELPFNLESGNYEVDVEVTLNRSGEYSVYAEGYVELGSSDCPDFKLNLNYSGVETEFIEFSVEE
ncbi:MAG: hypothetical protein BalsKO_27980 [Balneolaceae bacterium]